MSAACTCLIRWRRLYAVIDGVRYAVEPAVADTATSMLFRAWCAGCDTEYPHSFRISSPDIRAA